MSQNGLDAFGPAQKTNRATVRNDRMWEVRPGSGESGLPRWHIIGERARLACGVPHVSGLSGGRNLTVTGEEHPSEQARARMHPQFQLPRSGQTTVRVVWKLAERGGFEPPIRFYSYNGLANRRFRPLSHLSRAGAAELSVCPGCKQGNVPAATLNEQRGVEGVGMAPIHR